MSDSSVINSPAQVDATGGGPPQARTGVLLASTYALVREGLKSQIDVATGLFVAAQASSAAETLTRLQECPCGLLLLDLEIAGVGTGGLITQIRQLNPSLPVLVLTPDVPSAVIFALLQAGASSCVSKRSDAATLLQALRHVSGGGRYLDPLLVDAMVYSPPGPVTIMGPTVQQKQFGQRSPLSERESEVMHRLTRGERNQDIAADLGLSEKTIAAHKANIMRKLGLSRMTELVAYAESIRAFETPLDPRDSSKSSATGPRESD